MAIGSCRRCQLRPRRVRRGLVEPLCEECYREAMERVARELAQEQGQDGRGRYRKFAIKPRVRAADKQPARVGRVARVDGRRGRRASDPKHKRPERRRCINEPVLQEARRLHDIGLSIGAVAQTLLGQTDYANARSAESALRFHFRRRGWPLRRAS
jgi:hypothetical protein